MMAKLGRLRWLQIYGVPMAVGVVSSAIWWAVTLSWLAAVGALAGVVVISTALWKSLPFLVRIQQVEASEIEAIYSSQSEAETEIKALMESARSLDVLTVRGLGILGLNDSVLRKNLFDPKSQRCRIRVLLLSPSGREAPLRAQEVGESAEAFIHGINLAIERMRELAALGRHDVEIYLYDRQPCWRIIALDETYFVSVFGATVEGHRATMYRLDARRRSTLTVALARMFDELCLSGTRII